MLPAIKLNMQTVEQDNMLIAMLRQIKGLSNSVFSTGHPEALESSQEGKEERVCRHFLLPHGQTYILQISLASISLHFKAQIGNLGMLLNIGKYHSFKI